MNLLVRKKTTTWSQSSAAWLDAIPCPEECDANVRRMLAQKVDGVGVEGCACWVLLGKKECGACESRKDLRAPRVRPGGENNHGETFVHIFFCDLSSRFVDRWNCARRRVGYWGVYIFSTDSARR